MKNDFAATTITKIRNDEEEKVVVNTIAFLSQLQIPIITFDASENLYKEKLRKIPNVQLFDGELRHTQQLIASHKKAAEVSEFLLYFQSDKLDFAKNTARKMIEEYRNKNLSGMFVANRSEESIQTYPKYQQEIEKFINFFVSDYVGIQKDFIAGPKIFPAKLVKYLENVHGELGWGVETFLYATAKRLNMQFEFFDFFMNAPLDVDDEQKTKMYRLSTTQNLIEGLLQGIKIPL